VVKVNLQHLSFTSSVIYIICHLHTCNTSVNTLLWPFVAKFLIFLFCLCESWISCQVCINHAVKTGSSRLSVASSCRIHPKQAPIATSMLSSKLVRYNLDLLTRKQTAAVSFLNWHICTIYLYWGSVALKSNFQLPHYDSISIWFSRVNYFSSYSTDLS
jgi:hypothetical protein